MAVNISGTGFMPQAATPVEMLELEPEAAGKFQQQAEWAWRLWYAEADAGGRWRLWRIQ
jgi:hypothetical protein